MTKVDSKSGTQLLGLDDSDCGNGLAIFVSQEPTATVRYRLRVKAKIDQGTYDMGEFFLSPPVVTAAPTGRLSRLVAVCTCPGAVGWSLEVKAIPGPDEDDSDIPEETADIVLSSSKCCGTQPGLVRVSERYGYIAGTAITPTVTNYSVLAGQKVTGIAAIGLTGGGTLTINGGNVILVNDGVSISLDPKADIPPNGVIAFDNVIFALEFLESA
jgi:hypothetical protein